MDDGINLVLCDQRGHTRLISGFAYHERHTLRHRPVEAGRQIVEYDHAFASVDERVDHMTSDVASTAGDQDCHTTGPLAVMSGRVQLAVYWANRLWSSDPRTQHCHKAHVVHIVFGE